MENIIESPTGFNVTSSKFDLTSVENPFYETSSRRDVLIEQMKNNVLVTEEISVQEMPSMGLIPT